MPDELADAVFDMNGDERDIALANWEAAGADYQQQLAAYIGLAWFARTRRERCRLAAMQLMTPDRPLPMGDSGSGGSG